MKFFKAAILGATMLASPLSPALAQTTEDRIEATVSDLSGLGYQEFVDEMGYLLVVWDETGGSASNYLDASDILVEEIDAAIERFELDPESLPGLISAMQMIALNYSGDSAANGLEFNHEDALRIYEDGVVVSDMGPPVPMHGHYKSIMRRIYVEMWNRTSLDGLEGELAPDDYEKMLFDVYDKPTLCEAGEAVFWTCADPARDRYLSVCGSPTSDRQTSWVQYRVGAPGDLELAYPENKVPNFANEEAMMNGDGHFSQDLWLRNGQTLLFSNGAYDYAIDAENITDTASVSVTRDGNSVFSLECKSTYPFMDTIGGHLWGNRNDDALHIVPGARPDVDETACEADEDVVWSCLDTREEETFSVCTVPVSGEAGFFFREMDGSGTITSTAFVDDPVPASSERAGLRAENNETSVYLGEFAESFHFTANADGTGDFTWMRNQGERMFTQNCSVTHDNIASFIDGGEEEAEAGFTYDPQPILHDELSPSPDEFDALITLLKGLEAAGHFDAGAGTEPLDILSGQAAKPFALSLITEDFRCTADFGGMCSAPGDFYPIDAFLVGFQGSGEFKWHQVDTWADDFEGMASVDLNEISLTFAMLSPAGTPVTGDESGFCQARAYFDDWDAGGAMYRNVADQIFTDEDGNMEWLWDSFYGVSTRYNVRAQPSASADIVGQAENEAIHFPDFDIVIEAEGYTWREVVLPDGTGGFIAASEHDLLTIGNSGEVCAAIRDGEVVLTSVSIGGE